MMAVLLRSLSRGTRSPRLRKRDTNTGSKRASGLRRRREVSAAAARQQRTLLVEDGCLRDGELPAELHDLAARDEIAGHRRRMVIDAHVDGRHAAARML